MNTSDRARLSSQNQIAKDPIALEKPSRYRIVLIRAWDVQDADPAHRNVVWRYGVKGAEPAAWQHFADFEELVQYLRSEFGETGTRAPGRDER